MSEGRIDSFKISYNPHHLRVRLSFSRKFCCAHDTVPTDILERVRAKMEEQRELGHFPGYTVYESTLQEVWVRLRSPEFDYLGDDFEMQLTVAAGTPALRCIVFSPGDGKKIGARVTIDAGAKEIQTWRTKWLWYLFRQKFEALGLPQVPNRAQIRSLLYRAKDGERIKDYPLGFSPSLESQVAKNSPYALIRDSVSGDINVIIYRIEPFAQGGTLTELLQKMRVYAVESHGRFQALEEKLVADIEMAIHGIERVGLCLPLCILGCRSLKSLEENGRPLMHGGQLHSPQGNGSRESASQVQQKDTSDESNSHDISTKLNGENATAASRVESVPAYSGYGLLNILVSADRLSASIQGFRLSHFDRQELNLDRDWLLKEVDRLGIKVADDQDFQRIVQTFSRRRDPNGLVIARGLEPRLGSSPYLVPVLLSDRGLTSDHEFARRSHLNELARKGEIVARIGYKESGEPGIDVFGKPIDPVPEGNLGIELGEGVAWTESFAVQATRDGFIAINGLKIEVRSVYVHAGDVNLRTGDLAFEGSVEIQGNIETGATVNVSGDLTIKGSIAGARVYCGGRLLVARGVNTGKAGLVKAKGDLAAEFVENSSIFVSGNCKVEKVVAGSQVLVGGDLDVDQGIIAGGSLVVGGKIKVKDVGYSQGKKTEIILGFPCFSWHRKGIATNRQSRVQARISSLAQELKELRGRRREQLSDKMQSLKLRISGKLEKAQRIQKTLAEKIDKYNTEMSINTAANVQIAGTVYPGVVFTLGKKTQAIPQPVASVAFLVKPVSGSYMVPLEQLATGQDGSTHVTNETQADPGSGKGKAS